VKAETRSFYEAAALRAVEHVATSLDRAIDYTALARQAGMSPFHFHRVFRGLVGETPLELHRRLRLERAAERLATTDAAVTAIAFDAGFESHEAFTRAFRAAYATSPSEWRTREPTCHGVPAALPARCGVHVRDGLPTLAALTLIIPGVTTMNVRIENRPTLRLCCVRHLGPYREIGEAFHRLATAAQQHGLYAHADPRMLGLYHDDPETTPAGELRSDAALIVDTSATLPPGTTELVLAAGPYACTTHVGAYADLGDTWARLFGEWLPASGRRAGEGPSYEVYVTDPRTTRTEDLRTDLYVPLI
jgi:AraC family transcriptional regulator